MKALVATVLYVTIALAPIRWCHSTCEYLVTTLGAALLLDRYLSRWLPWSAPVNWMREAPYRIGVLAIGAGGFYVIRFGSVPWWESLYLGAIASLVIFLIESILAGASRLKWGRALTFGMRAALLALLVFAVPLEAIHPIHTVPRRTPSAQGLGYDPVEFTTSDGLRLSGWLVTHPQARGNVIYCHGHGRNRGQGAWLLPTLHEMRLNVLAFDFRGHGDSPGHVSTFGHEEVRDLRAAVHFLEAECPHQPLFIIGVSLGAAVTLQALPELPTVQGVWSEACFSRFSTAVDHYFSPIPEAARGPLVSAYFYAAWLDCGFWGPDINPKDALTKVRVPICFCHGKRDELVPFEEAEDLYESYRGPKWHYWVEVGNHYNLRQVAREEYLERLRDFLEERMTCSMTAP
jgi:fermentation-respiration switch protein FrsA (DUF1100 family)